MKPQERFIQEFGVVGPAKAYDREALDRIAHDHLVDLTTTPLGYFDEETKIRLTSDSAKKLAIKCNEHPEKRLNELWAHIVRDFHTSNFWDYNATRSLQKPIKKKKEVTIGKAMWLFIQAMLVMKTVILFLLAEYALDMSSEKLLYLLGAITLSFGSLAYFGWKYRKFRD